MSESAKRERPKEVMVPRELAERLLRDLERREEKNDGLPPEREFDKIELQRILR